MLGRRGDGGSEGGARELAAYEPVDPSSGSARRPRTALRGRAEGVAAAATADETLDMGPSGGPARVVAPPAVLVITSLGPPSTRPNNQHTQPTVHPGFDRGSEGNPKG